MAKLAPMTPKRCAMVEKQILDSISTSKEALDDLSVDFHPDRSWPVGCGRKSTIFPIIVADHSDESSDFDKSKFPKHH